MTNRFIRQVDELQQRRAWLVFPYAVIRKFGDDRAGYLAALIAYYGFFSIFPLLLALFTILSYVLANNSDLRESIVDSTLAQFPVIGDQIRDNVGSLTGNGAALVIGLAAALWAGLAALRAMQHALDAVWGIPRSERANMVISRVRALVMLVFIGGAVIALGVLGSFRTASATVETRASVLTSLLTILPATGVYLVGFKTLTHARIPWRDHLPGAVVGGVLFAILQYVGGLYVGRVVRDAEQTYGLFAVVIGLLSWMHLQAIFGVFSAEINVVRAKHLWPRRIPGGDPTPVDERLERGL